MSVYENKILPHLLDTLCSHGSVMEQRAKVVPQATGVVLEIGMGSGINLPLYNADRVDFVWGLEPSKGMRQKAQANLKKSPVRVEWLDLPSEEIPLDDQSVDTIVLTYTLCTIPDWQAALQQMHRVLKPDGRLLFCEHGHSSHARVAKWQHRITPMWKKMVGGCHLNRSIAKLIGSSGFEITALETCYMKTFPKVTGYMYIGEARKIAV